MREEPGPPSAPWHVGKALVVPKGSSQSPVLLVHAVMAERNGRDVPVPPGAAEKMQPWTPFTWAFGFFGVQNPARSPVMLLALGASRCDMEVA